MGKVLCKLEHVMLPNLLRTPRVSNNNLLNDLLCICTEKFIILKTRNENALDDQQGLVEIEFCLDFSEHATIREEVM